MSSISGWAPDGFYAPPSVEPVAEIDNDARVRWVMDPAGLQYNRAGRLATGQPRAIRAWTIRIVDLRWLLLAFSQFGSACVLVGFLVGVGLSSTRAGAPESALPFAISIPLVVLSAGLLVRPLLMLNRVRRDLAAEAVERVQGFVVGQRARRWSKYGHWKTTGYYLVVGTDHFHVSRPIYDAALDGPANVYYLPRSGAVVNLEPQPLSAWPIGLELADPWLAPRPDARRSDVENQRDARTNRRSFSVSAATGPLATGLRTTTRQ